MEEKSRQKIIELAENAVEAEITGKPFSPVKPEDTELSARRGCFVTLKTGGELRGCIGCFTSDEPLYKTVCSMARSSVSSDPRFAGRRLKPSELEELEVEVSVLSELKETDNPLSLRPGIDGIYITRGFASGCFLPQVISETGWSKEQFLSYCCSHKAGLPADAWKDKDTKVYLFTSEIISNRS
ncbi:AmmeMemoRadiSam system protein A [Sedimentisphaera salicampi]|uniref:AMMECR1 domain-containing protein n=1 Tax=Sedimentisphaera salicampi TaxID=1941349 RepID=A0A1W6LM26_9BACT|nr:AmmeMemoRadiSam system protein A [Sedimentisphaera salicampi]ARN56806.1 hypothetical protein STSP1_01198 [Sedimentisphaera salicampi]OXU14984.1 hypothetical protein SMSP1_01177 [Sedimentisphaera salicampi]